VELDRLIAAAPPTSNATDRGGDSIVPPEDYSFAEESGERILSRISRQLRHSSWMRILYGNPALLNLVESVYGPEFVPFGESIIVKFPGNGAEIPYHQDGKQNYHLKDRGINVGFYLHNADESNGCLRVIPGSHRKGLVDVHALRDAHYPILPGSVPLRVNAGECSIHDRSLIHGSLPNTSPDLRITVYFGYHKLDSVQGIHSADHIRRRAQVISLCIHEREASSLFPDETPYTYALANTASLPPETERDEVLSTPPLTI